MLEMETKSPKETQKVAQMLAEELLKTKRNSALVLALEGNLGAGKTTFTQSFAKKLGVKEKITSPTFVLMKVYNPKPKTHNLFVHIDCYRLKSPKDLEHLGIKEILKNPEAIVLIEWADRMKRIIPKDAIWIKFEHGKKDNERILKIK